MPYFGFGGKTDPNAKQGSHIMSNPTRDPAPQAPVNQPVDTHQEVQAFQRKLKFEQFKQQGMSPGQAAYRVGTNVPLGAALTPKDITQILQTGKLQRRRI